MDDFINNFWHKHHLKALTISTVLSVLSFLGNCLVYVTDGYGDGQQLHTLLAGASGTESLLVTLALLFLRRRQRRND